jgi:hypothetical protein
MSETSSYRVSYIEGTRYSKVVTADSVIDAVERAETNQFNWCQCEYESPYYEIEVRDLGGEWKRI